jgi:hypothetical protein
MSQEKLATSFKALAANSAESGVKKTDLYRIPPEKIQEEPGFNARDYSDPDVVAQIEAFADAYGDGRYIPPLIVRIDGVTGDIFVVEGHLRRRGALLAIERGAPLAHLDCTPFRGNDTDRVTVMLTSAQGLPLKPLGIAESYLRLQRMGLNLSEIAKRINRTAAHVESLLLLATANSDVQSMVRNGEVAASTAIEAVRKHGERAGAFLGKKLQEAKSQGKTSVKASAIKEWSPPRKQAISIYKAASELAKAIDADYHDALLEENHGKVLVDASVIAELLKAFHETENLRLKKNQTKDVSESESENKDSE